MQMIEMNLKDDKDELQCKWMDRKCFKFVFHQRFNFDFDLYQQGTGVNRVD